MMARSDAVLYLMGMCQSLAVETELSSGALMDIYTSATDNSLRMLGVPEAAIPSYVATDAQRMPYLSLLLYYALKQFLFLFATRIDVEVIASIKAARSQLAVRVQQLMDTAAAECMAYGYEVTGPTFQSGRVTLDYLEPAASEFGTLG